MLFIEVAGLNWHSIEILAQRDILLTVLILGKWVLLNMRNQIGEQLVIVNYLLRSFSVSHVILIQVEWDHWADVLFWLLIILLTFMWLLDWVVHLFLGWWYHVWQTLHIVCLMNAETFTLQMCILASHSFDIRLGWQLLSWCFIGSKEKWFLSCSLCWLLLMYSSGW